MKPFQIKSFSDKKKNYKNIYTFSKKNKVNKKIQRERKRDRVWVLGQQELYVKGNVLLYTNTFGFTSTYQYGNGCILLTLNCFYGKF